MIIPTFPTPDQIQDTINKVNKRLSVKAINMRKNAHVKEGFTDCLRILNDRISNPENPYFKGETEEEWEASSVIYRNQLAGIDGLKTVEGRSISVLCIDWLNGNNEAIKFLDVEIKMR